MRLAVIILLLFGMMLPSYAGDPTRKGTTGADQLLIPVGARSIATNGAFISSVTGLESIYYNPAGLDLSQRTEAMFSYMSYIADINISYFAAGTNLGDLGSFAISFKSLDFGDIEETTTQSPDGTGKTYSPSYFTFGLSYSKIITDRVSIGFNTKIVSETIMNTNATGFAFDFGVQYRFQNGISLSAGAMNIGSNMSYSGSDLYDQTTIPETQPGTRTGQYSIVTETFQMPSYFQIGLGYEYALDKSNKIGVAGAFVNNNSFEDQVKFGLEYGFMDIFYVRGGYVALTENTDQSIYNFTAGAGLNYTIQGGVGIAIDYAFRNIDDFPDPNHIFTVKLFLQ